MSVLSSIVPGVCKAFYVEGALLNRYNIFKVEEATKVRHMHPDKIMVSPSPECLLIVAHATWLGILGFANAVCVATLAVHPVHDT